MAYRGKFPNRITGVSYRPGACMFVYTNVGEYVFTPDEVKRMARAMNHKLPELGDEIGPVIAASQVH